MIYYFLPGTGIFGGIKKGFHAADLLTAAGYPCTVATPIGARPTWFQTNATVISHDTLRRQCGRGDILMFSCPFDAPAVDAITAGRKVLHMQGASPVIFPLFDPARGYEIISCGLHMTEELVKHSRVAPYVPLGISNAFFWRGEVKMEGSVAVMSRRGSQYIEVLRDVVPERLLRVIDGVSEENVAGILKRTDIFVAVSPEEWFGLPPLEAMAARCVVVGFPGVGGFEFMRHGETAHLVPNGDHVSLKAALKIVIGNKKYRDHLRMHGTCISSYYTMKREQEYLVRALGLK